MSLPNLCRTECKLDVAIVVDCSGSIRDSNQNDTDNWQLILNFIDTIVQGLKVSDTGTHVAAVTFGKNNLKHLLATTARRVLMTFQ